VFIYITLICILLPTLYIYKALSIGAGYRVHIHNINMYFIITLYIYKSLCLGAGSFVHIHNINMYLITYIVHL
jgi:hypothetical protein